MQSKASTATGMDAAYVTVSNNSVHMCAIMQAEHRHEHEHDHEHKIKPKTGMKHKISCWTPLKIIQGFCVRGSASALSKTLEKSHPHSHIDLNKNHHQVLRKHTCDMCASPRFARDPFVVADNRERAVDFFTDFVQECCVLGDGHLFSAMCEVQAAFACFLKGKDYMAGVCAVHMASSSFISGACKSMPVEISPGWRVSDVDTRYVVGLKVIRFIKAHSVRV